MGGRSSNRNPWVLAGLLIIGSLIGSLIGDALAPFLPTYLNQARSIGWQPTALNLGILQLTLGLSLKLNLASVLGFVAAYVVYRRL